MKNNNKNKKFKKENKNRKNILEKENLQKSHSNESTN